MEAMAPRKEKRGSYAAEKREKVSTIVSTRSVRPVASLSCTKCSASDNACGLPARPDSLTTWVSFTMALHVDSPSHGVYRERLCRLLHIPPATTAMKHRLVAYVNPPIQPTLIGGGLAREARTVEAINL